LKIHECFGMTREDVDMFFVNEGRPFAIKQTQDLILGLRLVQDDGPVHIKLVVKGEYRTMEGGKSVALDCKQRGSHLHNNAAEAKRRCLLEEQARELECQEREQEEERQRQETERRRLLLEEQARELERQEREQEEERQRQETERRRLLLEEQARELERQEREQEEERQRQETERRRLLLEEQARELERQEREREQEEQRQRLASAVTPEAFHKHCKEGRAAEVAAALEAARGDPTCLRALLEHRDGVDCTPLHYAACYGQGKVVQLLLEAGANRDARNNKGRTPLYFAQNPPKYFNEEQKKGCAAVVGVLS